MLHLLVHVLLLPCHLFLIPHCIDHLLRMIEGQEGHYDTHHLSQDGLLHWLGLLYLLQEGLSVSDELQREFILIWFTTA